MKNKKCKTDQEKNDEQAKNAHIHKMKAGAAGIAAQTKGRARTFKNKKKEAKEKSFFEKWSDVIKDM